MEFTWRGSPSLGPNADVKGFILSRFGNYGGALHVESS
jgi:hypothetical protein